MKPRSIASEWLTLARAFAYNAAGAHAFLDAATGEVRILHAGGSEFADRWREVIRDPDRFIHIDPVPSEEQHRWMAAFAASVPGSELRRRLQEAIAGAGAFRLFRQVINAYPDEERRWAAYRLRHLHSNIEGWLRLHRLIPRNRAPWAHASRRDELPEMSVDDLRAVAVGYLEQLPASELPCVIAFLVAMHQRPA